jgi:Spy/CpxP family protein refolding chaperone
MKRISLIAAFSMTAFLSLNAQSMMGGRRGHGGNDGSVRREQTVMSPQEIVEKQLQKETKLLGLTPEQVEKAKAIHLKFNQQRAELMAEYQQVKNVSSAETKMQGIQMAEDTEFKEILTPEQQIKFAKVRNKLRR